MNSTVLFFLDSLPVGGAERHSIQLAEALSERGVPCSILVYSGIRSSSYGPGDISTEVKMLNRGSNNVDFSGWKMASEFIREKNPDIVFAVNQATLAVAMIGKLLGWHNAKVVCIFHTTIISTLRGKLRIPLFKAFVKRANGIIYVSKNQKAYWEQRGLHASSAVAVVNGIDVDRYTPPTAAERLSARDSLGFGAGDLVVGLTAQFRPEKNHGELVEALRRLRARGVAAKVLFVGDGAERAGVESRVRELGLSEHVVFTGEQRDVRPFLAAMDVAVLTSKSVETLSLAALEAMACGVPLVLSDIGGASEIVESGVTGYLYPAGDVNELEARLVEIHDRHRTDAARSAARDRAVKQFSYGQMVEKYHDAIKAMISRGSVAAQ